MVPLGKGNPISSGNLDTLVFLTEKPPPLSFSEGGGSMSRNHTGSESENLCNAPLNNKTGTVYCFAINNTDAVWVNLIIFIKE